MARICRHGCGPCPNKHTFISDELFQETEQHRRLGGIRCGHSRLPAHHGAHRQSVGLHGIHRHIIQARSRTPSRSATVHDTGANIHPVLVREPRKRGHHGERHVEHRQRLYDSVPFLDDNAPRTQDFRTGQLLAHPCADMDGDRSRHHRSRRVHLHRHILVLGNRRRGLRPVLDVHGTRGVGHAQMGRRSRRAARQPLVGAHHLPHGTVHRSAYPQPADDSRAGVHILFPQNGQSHLLGRRQSNDSGLRHTAVHQLAGTFHRRNRRMVRPHVRKRARPAGEQRASVLHAGGFRRVGLGDMVHAHQRPRTA